MDNAQKQQELRSKTVPELFLERVKTVPNEVAYRVKKLGIYRERTWLAFHQEVARCAMGFAQLGLKHGDRVALMGDPSEEYTICELAAQALGAITYGIYSTSSSTELLRLMTDGKA
ncbi:MAG: AMP-binding protein, partial [Syntrophorhabdales bacterium]